MWKVKNWNFFQFLLNKSVFPKFALDVIERSHGFYTYSAHSISVEDSYKKKWSDVVKVNCTCSHFSYNNLHYVVYPELKNVLTVPDDAGLLALPLDAATLHPQQQHQEQQHYTAWQLHILSASG